VERKLGKKKKKKKVDRRDNGKDVSEKNAEWGVKKQRYQQLDSGVLSLT